MHMFKDTVGMIRVCIFEGKGIDTASTLIFLYGLQRSSFFNIPDCVSSPTDPCCRYLPSRKYQHNLMHLSTNT